MKIKQSAALASVVAGATLTTTEAGALPGIVGTVVLHSPAGAFVGSAIVQTSQDGTTWATGSGAVAVTTGGVSIQPVVLAQFLRLNCTAYTSGNIQMTLLADID